RRPPAGVPPPRRRRPPGRRRRPAGPGVQRPRELRRRRRPHEGRRGRGRRLSPRPLEGPGGGHHQRHRRRRPHRPRPGPAPLRRPRRRRADRPVRPGAALALRPARPSGGRSVHRLAVAFAGARRAGAFAGAAFAARGARVVAVAVLAGAAFAGAAFAGAGLASFGAGATPRTTSLNPLSGVMRAFFDALIRIDSPVAGLRPIRALVWILANLAKPVRTTGSPLATVAVTTSVKPRRTPSTVFGSVPLWAATAVTSSRRFMRCSPPLADQPTLSLTRRDSERVECRRRPGPPAQQAPASPFPAPAGRPPAAKRMSCPPTRAARPTRRLVATSFPVRGRVGTGRSSWSPATAAPVPGCVRPAWP